MDVLALDISKNVLCVFDLTGCFQKDHESNESTIYFRDLGAKADEAQKSSVFDVQYCKMQPWENFGHKLDSNYWQANTVLPNSSTSSRQKTILLDQSKSKLVSYSAMRTSLANGECFSETF